MIKGEGQATNFESTTLQGLDGPTFVVPETQNVPGMDCVCYCHAVTLSLPENTKVREGGVDEEEAAQKI